MTDLNEVIVTVELTYFEARALRSAAIAKARKAERSKSKGRILEEGKIDLNVSQIDVMTTVAKKLDVALTNGIEKVKAGS